MKIALITDTHFGARNDNLNFNEYFYKFYEELFFPYLEENDITTVIHLGDVMDRRKFISYRIAKDFRERFLDRFQKINLHMLVGNHDTYYKNTNDVNSLQELVSGKYDNIKVYSKATEVNFDGCKILFVPWINADNVAHTTKMLKTSDAQICMGHLELSGFEMQRGMVMDHGWDKEEFNRFDTIMSGHYHHKSDDGQVFYLGTPYEIYWNDWDDPKGFHVFDIETRELEFIPNERTIFEKIYYNDKKTKYSEVDVSQYDQKFVKVFVENRDDYYEFDKFLDRLYNDISVWDLKVVEDFSDLSVDFVSDNVVEESQDTLSLLDRYVEEIETTLDKERIKTKLKSLYIEAGDLEL